MSIDNITPEQWDQSIDKLATNNQVGGTHYNHLKIQPIDYIYANKNMYIIKGELRINGFYYVNELKKNGHVFQHDRLPGYSPALRRE